MDISDFQLFRKYLVQRITHENNILAVLESSPKNADVVPLHRARRDLLEDIIQDFDGFVKLHQNHGNSPTI